MVIIMENSIQRSDWFKIRFPRWQKAAADYRRLRAFIASAPYYKIKGQRKRDELIGF